MLWPRKTLVTLWQQTLACCLIKLCCVFILFFQEADQVWSPTDDGQTTGMITKNWITQIGVNYPIGSWVASCHVATLPRCHYSQYCTKTTTLFNI